MYKLIVEKFSPELDKLLKAFDFEQTDCKYVRTVPTVANEYDWTGFEIYTKSGKFEGIDGYTSQRVKGEIVIYGATPDHDEYFGVVHDQDLCILYRLIKEGYVKEI